MHSHFMTTDCCTLTDEEVKDLVDKYQAGDSEAAVPLLRSQGAWVMKMLSRCTVPSRVSADDIYSELVIAFLRGLSSYDPKLSQLSTFFRMIFSRRIHGIIRSLSDEANTDSSGLAGEPYADNSSILEDRESEAVICDIMNTHLTAFERDVLINFFRDIPLPQVADKANAFVKERSPEASPSFNSRSIKNHVDRAIGIVKSELKRRGDIDSESLQQHMF